MEIAGHYYDGLSSIRRQARLSVSDNEVSIDGEGIKLTFWLEDIKISDRIGNTSRYIKLADGSKFETLDNNAADELQSLFPKSNSSSFLHQLESKKRYILSSIVILILFSSWMGIYGVPWMARSMAHSTPAEINHMLGGEVVAFMDKAFFTPSKLDTQTKEKVHETFARIIKNDSENQYTLLFRNSEKIGANAFALPSGEIIITDQLIELAKNQEEILSILAHEVGHVKHRHGLQSVIQDSILTLLIMAITGDVASATTFAASIPIFLTESHYSREFEREADDFAFNFMQTNNIDTGHFANIMQRIVPADKNNSEITNYLSTHPSNDERIQKFIANSKLE